MVVNQTTYYNQGFTPSRYGYKAYTSDPVFAGTGVVTTGGRYQYVYLPLHTLVTLSRFDFYVYTAGASLTTLSGGIYDMSGNLLQAGTMDAAATWQATGVAGFSITATSFSSDVLVGIGFVGTTMPALALVSNTAATSGFPTANGTPRCSQGPSGGVTASAPPSTTGVLTATNRAYLVMAK